MSKSASGSFARGCSAWPTHAVQAARCSWSLRHMVASASFGTARVAARRPRSRPSHDLCRTHLSLPSCSALMAGSCASLSGIVARGSTSSFCLLLCRRSWRGLASQRASSSTRASPHQGCAPYPVGAKNGDNATWLCPLARTWPMGFSWSSFVA